MPKIFESLMELDANLRQTVEDLFNYLHNTDTTPFSYHLYKLIEASSNDQLFQLSKAFPVATAVYLLYTSDTDKESFFKRTLGDSFTLKD